MKRAQAPTCPAGHAVEAGLSRSPAGPLTRLDPVSSRRPHQRALGPVRVLHVVPGAEPNALLLDLLTGLGDRGVDSTVVTLGRPGPLDEVLGERGVPVAHLRAATTRDLPVAALRLRRHLTRASPDLVSSGMVVAGAATELARRLPGRRVPSVFTRHHDTSHHLEDRRAHVRIDAWTARSASVVLAPSEAVRRTLVEREHVPDASVVTVPHGVDATRLASAPEQIKAWRTRLGAGPLLVTASRVDPLKGFSVLLQVLARVREQHPGVVLAVAGAAVTSYDEVVRGEAERLGVVAALRLLGHVPDVHALMRAGDVYCSASEAESFGLGVLEAGMLGVPLAVTTPGGVREVLAGEHPPLAPGDVDSLTNRVLEHLADPQAARAAAELTAGRLVERFGIDAMADKCVAVYERIVRRAGGPGG